MATTHIGRNAEAIVAHHLESLGFAIVAQNWRTRWCEIDIIATKKRCVYFVEVRYRKHDSWGSGLESITPKKYQQMQFAAEMWLHEYSWKDEVQLMVASVSGEPPVLNELIEI